jgi:hypothetical protein
MKVVKTTVLRGACWEENFGKEPAQAHHWHHLETQTELKQNFL